MNHAKSHWYEGLEMATPLNSEHAGTHLCVYVSLSPVLRFWQSYSFTISKKAKGQHRVGEFWSYQRHPFLLELSCV